MFEQGIRRLPLVRNVYSGVKQVSGFLFGRREIQAQRIVAVEYPRAGRVGPGLRDRREHSRTSQRRRRADARRVIPCSPIPMSGFTIMVAKSECVDLNMSVEQAFQFIISCGVVIPPPQTSSSADARGLRRSPRPRTKQRRRRRTEHCSVPTARWMRLVASA